MWIEQDGEFNRLMVIVGTDPAFELLRWPRALAFQGQLQAQMAAANQAQQKKPANDNKAVDEATMLKAAAAALSEGE
jgi:hypothetical protein